MKYKITINPKIFQLNLPIFAFEGIVAHELAHTANYVVSGRIRTMMTGFKFITQKKHIEFDRCTDIDAITRGYGEGIKAYRSIAFKHLNDKQRAIKEQRYFSEQEINTLINTYKDHPQMRNIWLKNPPLNLTGIANSTSSYLAQFRQSIASNQRIELQLKKPNRQL